jgi:hypothetical protein
MVQTCRSHVVRVVSHMLFRVPSTCCFAQCRVSSLVIRAYRVRHFHVSLAIAACHFGKSRAVRA